MIRIAIIQFPGSNCERETVQAVQRAGMQAVPFLWNEKGLQITDMDGYILVGGFSYEDRSRAGIIAALDPLMQSIKTENEKGKPILGICNGAQILVETGLVPGLENNKVALVLTENKRMVGNKILGTGYYNAWINLRLARNFQRNAFTRHLSAKDILSIPIAHAEGRFILSDALLQEVENQGLNVFEYCDQQGHVIDSFPTNPNGSMRNIAAISNKAGNVLAMMPHPERTTNGDAIFHSMRDYISAGHIEKVDPLFYYPRKSPLTAFKKNEHSYECMVELMITDNHALTVQNSLQQMGFNVKVTRQVHWEIECESDEIYQQILQSGILYNERKEALVKPYAGFLVRAKEDLYGQQKYQTLQKHLGIKGIHAIKHGVLWQFSHETVTIAEQIEKILPTNIISNPYAHDCYEFKS